ncbi:MAG: hypothetical protein ACTSRZ_18150 [Promethearchaeota archaeon]
MALNPNIEQQILQQLNLIIQYLEGLNAQLNNIIHSIDSMNKSFAESIATLTENMRLIIEVSKKSRINLEETLDEMADEINKKIKELWEQHTLEKITEEEVKAIETLKELNSLVSENLYTQQLMSIIHSVRGMINRALAIKTEKTEL